MRINLTTPQENASTAPAGPRFLSTGGLNKLDAGEAKRRCHSNKKFWLPGPDSNQRPSGASALSILGDTWGALDCMSTRFKGFEKLGEVLIKMMRQLAEVTEKAQSSIALSAAEVLSEHVRRAILSKMIPDLSRTKRDDL